MQMVYVTARVVLHDNNINGALAAPWVPNYIMFSVIYADLVLLLAGEYPAAMQHGGQAHQRTTHMYCLIFFACMLLHV